MRPLLFVLFCLVFSSAAFADDAGTPAAPPAPTTPQSSAKTETVVLSREDLNRLISEAAKGGKPGTEPDPDPLLTEINNRRATNDNAKRTHDKIVNAAKFNIRLDTFLKEYAGVLPQDASEIPKAATSDKYPDELERSSAIKSALMQSFFKEEENQQYLSEAQNARWKAYQSLGTVGRLEEAESVYDIVFEPAVNHARAIRQAQLKSVGESLTGSSDSDIIFKKMHEKQLRSIGNTYQLNDVLHEQAKALGLAKI